MAWRYLPIVLVLVACIAIFSLVGVASWPLVTGWLQGAAAIGSLWWRVPRLRLGLSIGLLPLCVLLTWEGGLFFLPSAVVLVGLSIVGSPEWPVSASGRRGASST
jgi:hypothetical protein